MLFFSYIPLMSRVILDTLAELTDDFHTHLMSHCSVPLRYIGEHSQTNSGRLGKEKLMALS